MNEEDGASRKKCLVVSASIGQVANLAQIDVTPHDVEFVIVDEGDSSLRRENEKLLANKESRSFGPRERRDWFVSRFGSTGERYAEVIPKRCHAETSFAFLLALEEGYDYIIQIDDDAFPKIPSNFLSDHLAMLGNRLSPQVSSSTSWYNTLDMLEFRSAPNRLFPRGHPYSARRAKSRYTWAPRRRRSVLHMGHWLRIPDLDALTYIETGFLDDQIPLEAVRLLKDERVLVAPGTYFSVCSMNCSFRAEIIPAFYQFYMKYQSIDRFDDIWSGLIVKRIADHLNDALSLGPPLVVHRKRQRDLFLNLADEARGMAVNEVLWLVLDQAELTGKTYLDCYREIIDHLKRSLSKFGDAYQKFLRKQLEMMRLWSEVCGRLT